MKLKPSRTEYFTIFLPGGLLDAIHDDASSTQRALEKTTGPGGPRQKTQPGGRPHPRARGGESKTIQIPATNAARPPRR